VTTSDHHTALLRSLVEGRRFVVATDVLVASAAIGARLTELGAEQVLVVGGSRGTGELEPEVERDGVVLGLSGGTIMEGMRTFEAALADPPPSLLAALDAFDPQGDAAVVTPVFAQAEQVAGRPVFGARERRWRELEDKTIVDVLWDRAGVARAPSAVVPNSLDRLTAAARDLDVGAGTVWVADNRLGWHGGGDELRWVRDAADAEVVARYLADRAHRVRVMPFLDGRPCSIHGWVVGDEVVAFRPCEMVVLRETGRTTLRYAGAATTWHPSSADSSVMREVAHRTGRLLREEVGYRGAYTVDGVLTVDGFRPTELNPRFGIGLSLLGRGADLPLYLAHCATIERPDLDWRLDELEQAVLAAAAEQPIATAHTIVPDRIAVEREVAIRRDRDRFVVDEGADGDGMLQLGPATAGGLLRMSLDRFEVGPPVAPEAVRAFALARELFGLDLPEFSAAPELRPA
jgi:hypothetical protein